MAAAYCTTTVKFSMAVPLELATVTWQWNVPATFKAAEGLDCVLSGHIPSNAQCQVAGGGLLAPYSMEKLAK